MENNNNKNNKNKHKNHNIKKESRKINDLFIKLYPNTVKALEKKNKYKFI